MKIAFISSNFYGEKSGAKQVTDRNFKFLCEKFGVENIDIFTFDNKKIDNKKIFLSPRNKLQLVLNSLVGLMGGVTYKNKKILLKEIIHQKYEVIFLDNSCLGGLAKSIKSKNKLLKVITFFHNVETKYYDERSKVENKLYKILSCSAYFNEKQAVIYSDKIITLNSRDSNQIEKIYKRKSDLELPVSLEDNYYEYQSESSKELKNRFGVFGIFVGSKFFANVEAIKWIKDNIFDKILIVGKGMEDFKRLESENFKIIGTVKDLEPYYSAAQYVIMPIFSGAGMKVKTAEALMYGKNILATHEALEGYNISHNDGIIICKNNKEFKKGITKLLKKTIYNSKSRENFIKNHSNESLFQRFNMLLGEREWK